MTGVPCLIAAVGIAGHFVVLTAERFHQTWSSYTLGGFGIAALGATANFGLVGYVTESNLKVVSSAAVFLGVATTFA